LSDRSLDNGSEGRCGLFVVLMRISSVASRCVNDPFEAVLVLVDAVHESWNVLEGVVGNRVLPLDVFVSTNVRPYLMTAKQNTDVRTP